MRQIPMTLFMMAALTGAELVTYIYAYNKYGFLFLLMAGALSTYYGFRLIKLSRNNIFQSILSGRFHSFNIFQALRNPEGLHYVAIVFLIIPGLLTDFIGFILSFKGVKKNLSAMPTAEPLNPNRPKHGPKSFDLEPGEWNASPPQK